MFRFAVAFFTAFVAISTFAAPTTKPTAATRPAVKLQPLSERDTTTVKGDRYALRIPKDWKSEAANGATFQFELPHGRYDNGMPGNFTLFAGALCHPNATLDEQVDANKQMWQQQEKGFKLIKQESTDLDGAPAALLTYDRTYQITSIDPKTHAQKVSDGHMRCLSLLCVNAGQGYFIDFAIEFRNFDQKVNLIKRVLAGFDWVQSDAKK
jgi:hypothetical protein